MLSSNGLSCIACHSAVMIALPDDELRAVANSARFAGEPAAARLLEKLHPPQEQIRNTVEADKQRFLTALEQAELPANSSREPMLALVDLFEREVTTAQAAADFGLTKAGPSRRSVRTLARHLENFFRHRRTYLTGAPVTAASIAKF